MESMRRFDRQRVRVLPLDQRTSLSRLDEILRDPDQPPGSGCDEQRDAIRLCAQRIRRAREADASVMLIFGAHLIRNGAVLIVEQMLREGWISHLATNGAGVIHDWEYAYLGKSTECVRSNVAQGTFGTWDETGRFLMMALAVGGTRGWGYGKSLSELVVNDGLDLPSWEVIQERLGAGNHAWAEQARPWFDLATCMKRWNLAPGFHAIAHPYKSQSWLAVAARYQVPLTVHPGIGYDIVITHPWYDGALVGRAAQVDFESFCDAVDHLDSGVVLSVGSAIMGPQVFEKSLSCVHNVRLQDHREPVTGHSFCVVDLQEGGQWDWSAGEPPRDHPAYYLRFCKSYARMGGRMQYLMMDNADFLHRLLWELRS